jgi:glucosylceramidase
MPLPHCRFLDEYKKQGIEFWGISTGNEPINGILPVNRFNSMGWTPQSQRHWIKHNFGPALKQYHCSVKLLALDDQRFMLPWWINMVRMHMMNSPALSFIFTS